MGNRQTNVFLHIGLEKTGTTYLQKAFIDHHVRLADHGLLYPVWLKHRHDFLSRLFSGGSQPKRKLSYSIRSLYHRTFHQTPTSSEEEFFSFVMRKSSHYESIFLSDEQLSTLVRSEKEVSKLLGCLKSADCTVTVILTLRNKDEYLRSLYFEAVKAGETRSILQWINESNYPQKDFASLENVWRTAVQEIQGKLIVLQYESIRDCLLESFGEIIGRKSILMDYGSVSRLNARPKRESIERLRKINQALDNLFFPVWIRSYIRVLIQKAIL